MIPEDENAALDPDWKPFEIIETENGYIATMLGQISDELPEAQ